MKRVLIISYYWPPCGGIGVLRCLKLSKHIREFGWEPVVFTADNAHYPSLDETNFKDIPEGMEVLKGKIWEPYHIYKFITGKDKDSNVNNVFYTKEEKAGLMHNLSVWIRSNFFIPDARAWWIKPSVKKLLTYLENNPVDAIFSDGPPHSNTRIATLIKKKTGIPWLADFQDPWSQVDYFQLLKLTSWGRKKHLKLEQEALKNADCTTIVSWQWKKDLEELGASNVHVIPWGFDQDDYLDLADITEVSNSFSLLHAGIMGYDRNTPDLFRAIKVLSDKSQDFKNSFKLYLLGQVDHQVREEMQSIGISDQVKIVGAVDRKTALNYIGSSRILLLLLNKQPNAKGRIPGKLFEYMAVRRPILNLGPTDSDVEKILSESKAGKTFEYTDQSGLEEHLWQQFLQFQNGALANNVASSIESYSNRISSQKFASLLDSITS